MENLDKFNGYCDKSNLNPHGVGEFLEMSTAVRRFEKYRVDLGSDKAYAHIFGLDSTTTNNKSVL